MNRAAFEREHPGLFFLQSGDAAALTGYLRELGVLTGPEAVEHAVKAGDGNMNCTVRARCPHRSVIVKQSRPWVEKYPQFAAPWDRALVEAEFYRRVADYPPVCARMPRLLAADPRARVLVLEDLGPNADYLSLYAGDVLEPAVLDELTDFLSALHAVLPDVPGSELLANREMRALNSEHIFFIPLDVNRGPDLEAIQPGLSELAAPFQADETLRAEIQRLGREVYLADGPYLLHGDFFPGSFLKSAAGPKVIDPEFGFFGRAEFDAAVLLAHLVLAQQPAELIPRFLTRYRAPVEFDRNLLCQLVGVEMIRRLIGYAQLPLVRDVSAKADLLARASELVLRPDERRLTAAAEQGAAATVGGGLISTPVGRRRFIRRTGVLLAAFLFSRVAVAGREDAVPETVLRDRIEGLLLGSLVGDALGGPLEFQDPARVRALRPALKVWTDEDVLDENAIEEAAARLYLRSYAELRPLPEPYAHWTTNAAPGTVTDDSRHKMVLLDGLRQAEAAETWPFDVAAMARAYLAWTRSPEIQTRPGYATLADEWLAEWRPAARWVLGGREPGDCLPPERMWNGLPTCCGQMVLPPLAAIFAGRPEQAYRVAFHLAFFDNSWGRDLNAAYVAALATALVTPAPAREHEFQAADWEPVFAALRGTDPFEYGRVPWTERSVDRWLDLAHRLAREADRRPARLFAALDQEFRTTIKWEAQVPYVVTFAALALADYHPLAALQLSIEWGHDTDSYAQMLGALIGARYGASLFPQGMRQTVRERLRLDYGQEIETLVALLERLRLRTSGEQLFREG